MCTKFQVSIVFRLVRDLRQTTTLTDRYKRPNNAFVTGIRPYLSMNNLFNLFASAGLSEYLGFLSFSNHRERPRSVGDFLLSFSFLTLISTFGMKFGNPTTTSTDHDDLKKKMN